ncbi:MAG: putative nucleotidyltransferase [Lacunisphaera sp.]|nr:putative nucleotidyltransferase [Lacunisphaera sp.]
MRAISPNQSAGTAESLAILRGLRPELARQGVGRLWLFGSRARQTAGPGSDWDVLVEFTEPPGLGDYMSLKFWLEEKLGGRVDVVSRAACKPRFLAAINDELLDVA